MSSINNIPVTGRFGGGLSARFAAEVDGNGHHFIDRDGTRFRHVLNYLRSGEVHIDVAKDMSLAKEILEEAQFFNLDALADTIRRKIESHKVRPLPLCSVRVCGCLCLSMSVCRCAWCVCLHERLYMHIL